ncbi:hypothetical protein FKQ61_15735 [Vibrio sp. A14(2019)]|nr:hypothetical protein [Vibrio sp. A14(2019)]
MGILLGIVQKSILCVEHKNTRSQRLPGKYPEQKDLVLLSIGQSLRLCDRLRRSALETVHLKW